MSAHMAARVAAVPSFRWWGSYSLLLRAVWRELISQRGRSVTVIVGMTVALASVVAVHLLTERIAADLEGAYPASVAGLSHAVRAPDLSEADYFALRERWRDGTLALPLRAMAPVVEGEVRIAGQDFRLFAFDPLAVPATAGLALAEPRLLLEDSVLAHVSTHLRAGDVITAGNATIAVVGTFGSAGEPARRWLLADIRTGQRLRATGALAADGGARGQPDATLDLEAIDAIALDIVHVLPRWLVSLDAIFPGLASQLAARPPAVDIDGVEAVPLGDVAERRFIDAILFNLGALSMLAAVVAGYLIFQSGVNALRQRSQLLARLDALGLPPSVVRMHIAAEGLVLGLAGCVLGLMLGVVLAELLAALVGGGAATHNADERRWWSVPLLLKTVTFGCGAAVIGMLIAERTVRAPASGRRGTAAWFAFALGAGAVAAGIAWPATGSPGGFLAIAGLCIAVTAMLPLLLRATIAATAARRRPWRMLRTLNLRELHAALPDVQAAGAALLIAVAAAIGIGLMVESLRHGFDGMIAQRLAADVVLDAGPGGFQEREIALVRNTAGVEHVRGYRTAQVRIVGAGPADLQVARLDAWELARYGITTPHVPGTVYLSEPAARLYQVAGSGQVEVAGTEGRRRFETGSVFRDYGSARPRLLLDVTDAAALIGAVPPVRLSIIMAPDAPLDEVDALAARFGWQLETVAGLRDLSARTFDRTFRITDALAVLALVVAVVGLYNALSSLTLKRAGDLQLLHALGVDPWALLRMTLTQAFVLAVLLMIVAIPVGVTIAWLLCAIVNPRAFGWSIPFVWSVRPVAVPVVLGIIAAAAAGALPAWRSAQAVP